MTGIVKKVQYAAGMLGIALLMGGCNQTLVRDDLEAIRARGELIVITRNNATCYYEAAYGQAGFEYELAEAFADHLGVKLRPLVIEDEAEMVAALRRGDADLIAAGVPFGRSAAKLVTLGPGYLRVRKQVVGRRGGPRIANLQDLADMPMWVAGSSAVLEVLLAARGEEQGISWQTLSEYSSEEMLRLVWNRSIPLTVVESNMLTMNRRFFPELVVHLSLGEPQQLRWAMNPQSRQLYRAVTQWFAEAATQDALKGLKSHYYSHLEDFDYVDMARYRRRITQRLPKYQGHFEEAAKMYGVDWQLVAAQAYQESHWDPGAKSFTGVRGIMMLTLETAKTLGLKNRLSVKDAIYAGTRYLARLHRLMGESVSEP
ncbi:MAG: transporter substrate-binding domain-containing protein, partial [Desulfatitalea sp.]|nr:transporter substrate-binding domain-containing protein [Desulfatitalea sp.]NNK02381.1 transporter substrate-binding domain-containing protein [Desulfatitalea sp.]